VFHKGTPVISSCMGTQPELIDTDKGGMSTNANYDRMLAYLDYLENVAPDSYFRGIQDYMRRTFVQEEEEIARVLFVGRALIEQPSNYEQLIQDTFASIPYAGEQRRPSEQLTAECMAH
jgi:hypothetical protein